MTDSKTLLKLAEHYRQAKNSVLDRTQPDQLEVLERSYRLLAESAEVLERSSWLEMKLGKPGVKRRLK
jgi:hypothetical protein